MPEITRAKSLHQGQFTRLIKITQATSRYPERDVLVLMLLMYQRAGIKGGSSHSGRCTFASKVLAATGDIETMAQLLGRTSIDCSQCYVDVVDEVLKGMFRDTL